MAEGWSGLERLLLHGMPRPHAPGPRCVGRVAGGDAHGTRITAHGNWRVKNDHYFGRSSFVGVESSQYAVNRYGVGKEAEPTAGFDLNLSGRKTRDGSGREWKLHTDRREKKMHLKCMVPRKWGSPRGCRGCGIDTGGSTQEKRRSGGETALNMNTNLLFGRVRSTYMCVMQNSRCGCGFSGFCRLCDEAGGKR